jgi:hypothetical protein
LESESDTNGKPDPVAARLRALRDLEPPSGARQRVFSALEQRIHGGRPTGMLVWGGAAVALALAVAWMVWPRSRGESWSVVAVRAAVGEAGPLRGGQRLRGRVRVEPTGSLEVALAAARVSVDGPASVSLGEQTLVLEEGRIAVDGRLQVEGGTCQAWVDGRCDVVRVQRSLRFVVEAGHVEARQRAPAFSVEDLPNPADRQVRPTSTATATHPTSLASLPAPSAPNSAAGREHHLAPAVASEVPVLSGGLSDLAQQNEAYRSATALQERDDRAALAALRQMSRRWPRGPLGPEVDFQIVRTLVRLGRTADARAAATIFLRVHPGSAHSREMQFIAARSPDAPGTPSGARSNQDRAP